ncbi:MULTISPECIES: hypothetical protein [Yersinia]|uniref:hypothetical protein n=1 Tax=Yersinia TaxID=629 RepID=UPI000EB28D21|nr:hypothetical protein [Yersinia sp. IP36721]
MTKESVAAGDLANLGLGDSATRSVGITTGTVAAGNDSRIVNAISKLDENISLPGNLTSKGTATAFKLVADDGSKTGIIYADGDVEGLRWGTSGSTGSE